MGIQGTQDDPGSPDILDSRGDQGIQGSLDTLGSVGDRGSADTQRKADLVDTHPEVGSLVTVASPEPLEAGQAGIQGSVALQDSVGIRGILR